MSNPGLLKPDPGQPVDVSRPLFHDVLTAGRKAGDAAANRLAGISDGDTDRVDTSAVADEDDVIPFDEPYTCVSHALSGDDSTTYYSFLLFPSSNRDTIVEDYSLWPGDFDAEFDDEGKLEAVAHNIANAAIDTYVAASTDDEFDVAPPALAEHEAGKSPVVDHYDGDDHAAILNRLEADGLEFRHVLVGPSAKFDAE